MRHSTLVNRPHLAIRPSEELANRLMFPSVLSFVFRMRLPHPSRPMA
jgi:hypothetical protein